MANQFSITTIKNEQGDLANGVVIYRGPSMLDGQPIVAIATGLVRNSTNVKTGAMVQTWIMRSDVSPVAAVNDGSDASVCGSCPLRGDVVDTASAGSPIALRNVGRACYVTLFQAPLGVFESCGRGLYPDAGVNRLAKLFAGRLVRIGSYGDPAAVPLAIWTAMLGKAAGHTGYTHQWRNFPELAAIVMASCDTAGDRIAAKMLGFRTFRVVKSAEALVSRERIEVVCAASDERGNVTTCAACRACGGTTAKARADIVIAVHGSKNKVNSFNRLIAA
jgi:hypothetical protein